MRIERHRERRAAALAGALPHAVNNLHVAAVQAVEVAQRQDRLVPARRPRVIGKGDDIHSANHRRQARETRARADPTCGLTITAFLG